MQGLALADRHRVLERILQLSNVAGPGVAEKRAHGVGGEPYGAIVAGSDAGQQMSGQGLEHPIDLEHPHFLELAKSLAKLDGALHISADNHLHRFSCLLDGTAVPGEDLSRGARYNSALRFTSKRGDLVVVVVSVDQPVSVIQGGVVKFAQCQWKPVLHLHEPPMTLEAWCRA